MRLKWLLVITGISLAMAGGVMLVTSGAAPQAPGVFHAPPEGWNPVTASDSELNYYNIPPRPSAPDDLARWKSVVTNMKWVKPEFKLVQPRMGPSRGETLTIHETN